MTTPTPPSTQTSWLSGAEATAKAELARVESMAKQALSRLTGSYAISLTALLVSVFVLFKSCR